MQQARLLACFQKPNQGREIAEFPATVSGVLQAVRNFVQLCLEGFYDKTPFHRILKGELAQGGDPTGTGNHSESVFGEPFKDEFHSRLRFSHRYMLTEVTSTWQITGMLLSLPFACSQMGGTHTKTAASIRLWIGHIHDWHCMHIVCTST